MQKSIYKIAEWLNLPFWLSLFSAWAAAFHGFLEDEFSEENLDFWSDVEAYKKSSSKKQVESARKIFQKYVATDSPQEVRKNYILLFEIFISFL